MSDCRHIEKKLLEIVELAAAGELPDEVKTHLDGCDSCRELVQQYAPIFSRLGQDPQEPPGSLWRAVQERVNEYEERGRASVFSLLVRPKIAILSLRSLVVLAATALGIYLGSGLTNGSATLADQLANDYSLVFSDLPAASFSETYLELEWENGGNGQ